LGGTFFQVAVDLVAPLRPSGAALAGEQFEIGGGAAFFDELVQFVRFAGMLPFALNNHVDLPPRGGQRADLPFDAEQNQLGDVSKVEADTSSVGTAIFADFVPDKIRFVSETPGLHQFESFNQEGVGAPQIKMAFVVGVVGDGKSGEFGVAQGAVTVQPAMFRGDLAGPVGKSPGGIDQNSGKPTGESLQFVHGLHSVPSAGPAIRALRSCGGCADGWCQHNLSSLECKRSRKNHTNSEQGVHRMRVRERPIRQSIRTDNGNRVIDSRNEPGKQGRAVRVCCTACGELLGVRIGKKSRTINCPECGVELRLPTLRDVRAAQQAKSDPVELAAESLSAPPRRKKEKGTDYVTLTCPLCNARLHPTVKQEAQKITCPDCYIEINVPARRDVAESSKEPYEPPDPGEYALEAPRVMPKRRPQLNLASASREMHREKPPTPPRWTFFTGVFNFPCYRGTVFRWVWISLGFTLCGMLAVLVSRLLMAMGGFALVAMGFLLLPLIWFTIWTFSYAAACCMPVLLETAAGGDEVRDWPEPNWREWAMELFYFVWLGMAAGLVAWGVAKLVEMQTGQFWSPFEISWLVSYPFLLLSAMETNSIWRPFSLPLLRTLFSHGRYWLLFYGLTAVLAAFWLVAFEFGRRTAPFLSLLLIGPLSAACVLIYTRLVGRLAWRITQVKRTG